MFPWQTALLLAMESNHVICLRLGKLASGGQEALDEADLMVSEKVDAMVEAGATLLGGGNISTVVDRYREHVAANARRLA